MACCGYVGIHAVTVQAAAVLTLMLVYINDVQSQTFTPPPSNVAFVSGDSNKVIECGLPGAVIGGGQNQWHYTMKEAAEVQLFGDRFPISGTPAAGGEFELEDDTPDDLSNYNMMIVDVTADKAGMYRCRGNWGSGHEDARAEVVVLDSKPTCHHDHSDPPHEEFVVGDTFSYLCEVSYTGNMAPTMEWQKGDPSFPAAPDSDPEDDGSKVSMTSSVTVTKQHEGAHYSCYVYFKDRTDNPGEGYDLGAPEYTHECHTNETVISPVKWPPSDVKIDGAEEVNYENDILTCSGDASGPRTFVWMVNSTEYKTENDDTSGGTSTLVLDAAFTGAVSTVQCVLKNTIREEEESDQSSLLNITVEEPPTTTSTTTTTTEPSTAPELTTPDREPSTASPPDPSRGTIVDGNGGGLSGGAIAGIVIGCLAVAVVIIVFVYICCVRSKSTKDKEAKSSNPTSGKSGKHMYGPDHVRGAGGPDVVNNVNETDDPRKRNAEGLVYADLALDNTPRSRNPIQVYEGTEYAEIQRPPPRA